VIRHNADCYRAFALTANQNIQQLVAQCQEFKPAYVVIADATKYLELKQAIKQVGLSQIEVLAGVEGLETVSSLPETDQVMAAIVGAAGLLPTLAAAKAGKRILLANKEALVISGALLMQTAADNNAEILPVDSEHNAIFQAMPPNFKQGLTKTGVEQILLTASGGPFRQWDLPALEKVTPKQAIAHPNWDMGAKISVDSATLMNKGLEVIEAHWLFNASAEQITVVVHPQSVIHSLVQYKDGSVLAQLGNPDMRTPIAYCMAYPKRIDSGVAPLDLFALARFDFEKPDTRCFPCLQLCYDALQTGEGAPVILNAANEIAVDAFLKKQIGFMQIPILIESCLNQITHQITLTLEGLLELDQETRQFAQQLLESKR
jgi:1-deoxy-D-xylulose-5-phosphate reductoisomerase